MSTNLPFLYPNQRHRRGSDPGPFKSYRTYKKYLRVEFGGQCIYCRAPDRPFAPPDAFAVEHFRPQIPFTHLTTAYSNLFYSCSACNSRKGNYWPKEPAARAGKRFANPCDDRMSSHLFYRWDTVLAQSEIGHFMIRHLDLNEERRRTARRHHLAAIARWRDHRTLIISTRDHISRRLQKASDPKELSELEAAGKEVETELQQAERMLLELTVPVTLPV